jgi:ribosomal protein S18 acetylase RimI-like enzyme
MLSWAAWQRVHAVDPQWRQDAICSGKLDTMRWERWTNWQRGDPRWRVHVLDSTNLTIDQMVGEIVAWVQASHYRSARSQSGKPRTVLRPARQGDFDYCARLYFEGMEKIIKELNLDMSAQIASFRQRWDVMQIRIVTLDGTDIGWLQSFIKDDALFLGQLFVNESLRGQGIGTELVKGLIEEAASVGRAVTLGVMKTNPALRLYERLGFRTTHDDERKFYMRRDLRAPS